MSKAKGKGCVMVVVWESPGTWGGQKKKKKSLGRGGQRPGSGCNVCVRAVCQCARVCPVVPVYVSLFLPCEIGTVQCPRKEMVCVCARARGREVPDRLDLT